MDQRTQHISDLNFNGKFILYADKSVTYFARHNLTLQCVLFEAVQISLLYRKNILPDVGFFLRVVVNHPLK
jgi:hypothetical protein